MSIIISGIKLPFEALDSDAISTAVKFCKLKEHQIRYAAIYKRSFDLRRGQLSKVYSVEIASELVDDVLVKAISGQNVKIKTSPPTLTVTGERLIEHRPVVVGFGPAGMFCALLLAKLGYRPIVLERGLGMEQRDAVVNDFFQTGKLLESSNIQFGEGGAGAYSDGKLTTRINDSRCELVLKYLLEHGAPAEIATAAKPHIGTDLLKNIVIKMRRQIIELGGEVRFGVKVNGFTTKDNTILAVKTDFGEIPCSVAVLATGHSARDTYEALHSAGLDMEQKAFSVGVRIEHLQGEIDRGLYGRFAGTAGLPKGEYALSHKIGERVCYSFCMCPGGQVVAAASEQGGLVTNGMSLHARDGKNANAAIVVSINPKDFDSSHPLEGIKLQRRLEMSAFEAGGRNYNAPIQTLGDFVSGAVSTRVGRVEPSYPVGTEFCDLNEILPSFITDMIKAAMPEFGRKINGFDAGDSILTGVETRTSSPVRIMRGNNLESVSVKGIIPCGEGAGYAGGIMSAAVDGIRASQQIISQYRPY